MKRASSVVLAMLMAAGMAWAQTGGGAGKVKDELNPQPLPPGKKVQAQSKTKKAKSDKKSKKGASAGATTSTPK